MKAPRTLLIVTIIVLVSVLVQAKAAPCEISAEAICQLNGPGVHCQPCKPDAYVVCTSILGFTVQTCATGEQCMRFASARQKSQALDPAAVQLSRHVSLETQ
jgi:hypothetical protein